MREGLASYEERTSTPVLQSRQKERERTTHKVELRGAKEHREEEQTGELYSRQRLAEMLKEMEDCYKREVSAPEDLESCQTEEPEAVAEGTVTPADPFLITLNEMEERANRTRERIQESIDLLKQKMEESEIDSEPLLLRSSPRNWVQKKKYKQVSGTLLLQDIKYPDDLLQTLQPQRQRTEEKHMSERVSRRDEQPMTECPILIKQGHAQYIPWASQDLDTLVSRLPDIHEGAGKWIRTFEEETTGKLLALGDIKALLAKCLGASKMNDVLKQSGLLQAVDRPQADGVSFDKHRRDIWKTLRTEYPMQTDPGFLKGEPMGEAENPTTYIQKQLRRWKEELERDPEQDKVVTALFRTAIVEAMPSAVKAKLEDVVGLNSKSHKEFRDHVVHAVEQYRRQELKVKNQEKELQRKLTQLQLEELINKKKKVQAVQKEDQPAVMAPVNAPIPVNPSATVNALAPASQTTAAQAPPAGQVTPQGPAPVVIYLKPEQSSNRNWNRQQQQGGRGRGRFNNNQQRAGGPPGVCWGCNQPGHNRRDCPINPWQQNQPMAPGVNYGQQQVQAQVLGPVNPWRGPEQGATFSCLNPIYASHLPMSGKYMKTVGFSGVTQLLPMTAPGCTSKDLGPMMKKAERNKWEATENPLIFQSADEAYLKILCATPMMGTPRMIVNTKTESPQEDNETKQTELLKEMEKQVPPELWSQHDTDVGLVKSANPVRIALRSGAKPPRKMQYPLRQEAEEGIKKTIEGLMKSGVLVETTSYCNTPILPVAKADKSKWRLVHDLRAVNEVVEDWPAEVPNPHMLLTNVPSAANYYTVIDLCSAFFSVPLAEESRPLFAYTYQGYVHMKRLKTRGKREARRFLHQFQSAISVASAVTRQP
ncbi:Gag-Pol polyprotein [Labeo rohita]|uniref:ribonuclease H n=1 Tax=Labeo rohita TaxID=84645 RepID=A0ABQ8L9A5_LABRO|nr:Gag-Pol polyprotein [Labeo rohita]